MGKIRFLALILFSGVFLMAVAYASNSAKDILTPQERLWLTQNETRIVYAVETNYAPFVFIGSNDRPTGLAYDYMRLVESKLGVKFTNGGSMHRAKAFLAIGDFGLLSAVCY